LTSRPDSDDIAGAPITQAEATRLREDIARVEATMKDVVSAMHAGGYRPQRAARPKDQRGALPWKHMGPSPFWAVHGYTDRAASRLGDVMGLIQEAREDLQAAKSQLNAAGHSPRG